jgi:hypothetical protein
MNMAHRIAEGHRAAGLMGLLALWLVSCADPNSFEEVDAGGGRDGGGSERGAPPSSADGPAADSGSAAGADAAGGGRDGLCAPGSRVCVGGNLSVCTADGLDITRTSCPAGCNAAGMDCNSTGAPDAARPPDAAAPDAAPSPPDAAPAVCGDGRITGPEICDDGANNGTQLGQCNPACSGKVARKRLRPTPTLYEGNLGGVAGADAKCVAAFGPTYKALISDGMARVATTTRGDTTTGTGILATGSVDWVLKPYTQYVNASDQLVWSTDQAPFLGVSGGRFVMSLTSKINPLDAEPSWAGVEPFWMSTPNNCKGWNSNEGRIMPPPTPENPMPTPYGIFGGMFFGGPMETSVFPDNKGSYSSLCNTKLHVMCAEQ